MISPGAPFTAETEARLRAAARSVPSLFQVAQAFARLAETPAELALEPSRAPKENPPG
jgi:hypothetical protein